MVVALPFKFVERFGQLYSKFIDPSTISIHHIVSFLLGVLMLLLAHRLYKRIRLAWVIEVGVLTGTLLLHTVRHQGNSLHFFFIELFALTVLVVSYKDFGRKADPITIKKALAFIATSLSLVFLNATLGLLILKTSIHNVNDIFEALIRSVQLLVFMDKSVLVISGRAGSIYADSLIAINWICIIAFLMLLLKPLVFTPIVGRHDKEKVHSLVLKYGQNPISYLALENDKKYFFGSSIEGVCAYQIATNVFVVCGDMICNPKDGFAFLSEILSFCRQNGYDLMFLNVTEQFTELYRMAGFGTVKYGEDACFKLSDYNLSGGKVAKVRAAINHANRIGIQVLEYKPAMGRNMEIEKEIEEITKEWLKLKGGDELGFLLGGTGLNNPMDRRYFYGLDENGMIQGFVVFLPYLNKKGYLADVTRRRNSAPQGVLEKIIYDGFMVMKEEGSEWGNMGLSPLYNVAEGDRTALTEKIFSFIYENMNYGYDFKALHHAKKKYAPTDWQPRFLAFYPKPFALNFGYALLKVQMSNKIFKTILASIKKTDDAE